MVQRSYSTHGVTVRLVLVWAGRCLFPVERKDGGGRVGEVRCCVQPEVRRRMP